MARPRRLYHETWARRLFADLMREAALTPAENRDDTPQPRYMRPLREMTRARLAMPMRYFDNEQCGCRHTQVFHFTFSSTCARHRRSLIIDAIRLNDAITTSDISRWAACAES